VQRVAQVEAEAEQSRQTLDATRVQLEERTRQLKDTENGALFFEVKEYKKKKGV
jgi:hypothetical protein